MQEHKEKEMEKRDNKKKKMSGEKKFYMTTAIGCAVALAIIVILAVAISGKDTPVVENQANNQIIPEETLPSDREENDDEQVSTQPDGMIVPIASSSVSQEHGFHRVQRSASLHPDGTPYSTLPRSRAQMRTDRLS